MKTIIIPIFAALLLIVGCSKPDYEITEPDKVEQEKAVEIGSKLAGIVMDTLRNALMAAMQEGGPMEAVKVCNTKALIITQLVAGSSPVKVDIKRTSLKYRNPRNKPNEIESKALEYYQDKIADRAEIPMNYVQKVSDKDGIHFYYYRPIKIMPFCLACHGDEKTIHPGMKPILKQLYPDDLAIGYKEGDLRGLLRVRIDEKI